MVRNPEKRVEPIDGETRGDHYDYCAAVNRRSRFGWAPDSYVFSSEAQAFQKPKREKR